MPTVEGCKQRQQRLLEHMEKSGLNAAVLSRPKTICYFTGIVPDPSWTHALVISAGGDATLVTVWVTGDAAQFELLRFFAPPAAPREPSIENHH